MVKSARRKSPPSRIKYEQAHPIVSCRVPRDIYDKLQTIKGAGGKSFTDFLKLGMDLAERDNKEAAKIRKQGRDEGYHKGFADAELRYKVTYPCSVCGQTMVVTDENEKKAIEGYMAQAGWQHSECRRRTG